MKDNAVSLSPQPAVLEGTELTARFGLLALATDLTSEGDFYRIFPAGTTVHTARVAFANPTTPENLRKMAPHIAASADLLVPGAPLKGICYSCTSAAATIGEEAVEEAIHAVRPGVPVVTPTAAAGQAFRALGVRRLALLTPYLPATSEAVADYLTRQGFDVVRVDCFGLEDDRDMARISQRSIIEAALALGGTDNEAIFLSCTALPAVGTIAEIETRTGKPVVTSNQASAWAMLRLGGFSDYRPERLGRLFTLPFPREGSGRAA